MLIIALSFIWRLTYIVLSLLERSHMDSMCTLLFLVNNQQYIPVGPKMISSWLMTALCVPKALLALSKLLQCTWLFWLVFSWCPSCMQMTRPEFLPIQTFFYLHHCYRWAQGIPYNKMSWVSMNSPLLGKCQTLTYAKPCRYVGLSGYSSPQHCANSSLIVSEVLVLDNRNYCSGENGPPAQHLPHKTSLI